MEDKYAYSQKNPYIFDKFKQADHKNYPTHQCK